ncbi:RAD55 family ATPase [Haloglomus litoreum]|uniref:RAD55 family ATPase n=1 Tax=Haloglomus litoreum TaxID=3034026 RepID=UPI0023E78ED4|nr:HTR-like protein [Haloglomus sp. DT116]
MDRIPFGIRRLDTTIDGGVPAGSVVLLSGEAGAGAREFMYTCAAMNGLLQADPDLFDLYYGDLASGAVPPEEVHYLSFTSDERKLRQEMGLAMDDDLVSSSSPAVTFHDLSSEFFQLSPVPREWYSDRTATLSDLNSTRERQSVPAALGERLSDSAANNLVVIDSLTDLVAGAGDDLAWDDIPVLLKGISRAAFEWKGIILAHVNKETLSALQHGQLMDAADGTLLFEWESGGSTRARTMVVKQFRGVLSRIEQENIVRFETEIGDAGFDISDVRKIR